MVALASTVLSLVIGFSAPLSLVTSLSLESWTPEVGDVLIVDTKDNIGYLVHTDGVFLSFLASTGQRKVVRYLGRTYNAMTPEKAWVAKSFHIQSDRITFGAADPNTYPELDGAFLRLYVDGTQYTHYGIHPTKYSKSIFAETDRYESMGCIIVSDEMMEVILETWRLNGKELTVVTKYGLPTQQFAQQ